MIVLAGCKGFFDPYGGNWRLDGGTGDAPGVGIVNSRVADAITTATTAPLSIEAGDLVLVAVICQVAEGVTSVQDVLGNVYVPAGPHPATSYESEIWYAANTSPGTTAVTVTTNGTGDVRVWLLEVSGMDLTAPLDITTTNTAPDSGYAMGASVTTGIANELVLTTIVIDGDVVTGLQTGSPFTAMASTNGADVAYLIAPAPGTYTPNWATGGGGTAPRNSLTAAFKPAP